MERELIEQQTELVALKELSLSNFVKEMSKDFYDKVLISDNDKIIPSKSQTDFWGIDANLKGGHCPFLQFKKWSELL